MAVKMQLRYDEDFVEGVVFVCANDKRAGIASLQIRRFNLERERLYSILDPDERNSAFFRLHLDWFREWGLEKILNRVLEEFPLLPGALNALGFRKARAKNEEGAEMYVSAETGRNGIVALRPERFENLESLTCFLRHELTHLQDMIDPAFGYSPHLQSRGQTTAQQRLTRERYRLLWDITIDGRLANSGRATATNREQHQGMFERAYSFWPAEKRETVFKTLWHGRQPRHNDLLAFASDPRDLNSVHEPLPGACCPLCGFPTFDWADVSRLTPAMLEMIRGEFPDWVSEQGVCSRCVEAYNSALKYRDAIPLAAHAN